MIAAELKRLTSHGNAHVSAWPVEYKLTEPIGHGSASERVKRLCLSSRKIHCFLYRAGKYGLGVGE